MGTLSSPPGRLLLALPLCAAGIALPIRSQLGASPWDVFHLGLHQATGLSVGAATAYTSIAAVLVALAAGVRPGPGTLTSLLLLGPWIDLGLALVPDATGPALAAAYLLVGLALTGAGTGLFLSARLGGGPRDSLMIALARRTSRRLGPARLALELAALTAGLLLGGQLGAGTVVYAIAVGPAVAWGTALFPERPC